MSFCGPAVSELFFALPDMNGYKSGSNILWVCVSSDISEGKKRYLISAVKNVFNVRVNVLEFLRVKGVSFKSRVEEEFETSRVHDLSVLVLLTNPPVRSSVVPRRVPGLWESSLAQGEHATP